MLSSVITSSAEITTRNGISITFFLSAFDMENKNVLSGKRPRGHLIAIMSSRYADGAHQESSSLWTAPDQPCPPPKSATHLSFKPWAKALHICMSWSVFVQMSNMCGHFFFFSNENKKFVEWTAKDFSTDEPVRKTFKVQFSSKNAVVEFRKVFEEASFLSRARRLAASEHGLSESPCHHCHCCCLLHRHKPPHPQ